MSRKTCNRPKNKKKNGPKNENHMARISNQRKKKTKSVTSETSISVKKQRADKEGAPIRREMPFQSYFQMIFLYQNILTLQNRWKYAQERRECLVPQPLPVKKKCTMHRGNTERKARHARILKSIWHQGLYLWRIQQTVFSPKVQVLRCQIRFFLLPWLCGLAFKIIGL